MKKGLCFCLIAVCSYCVPLFAKPHPVSGTSSYHRLVIPISYAVSKKSTVLYLPSACSGLINDAVASEGELTVSVQGRIQNEQLSVQVKVDYKGSAVTTIGSTSYEINSSLSASETKAMGAEPVDVFVKGLFKLTGKNKSSSLFIGDIGYITVYPDGSITNHILDPRTDPDYSLPKVYCKEEM